MFSAEQQRLLGEKLDPSHVKGRKQGGREVGYIEGWHTIAEANRIFGFDGWERETVETKLVVEHEATIGERKDKGWRVTYTARVRVSVRAGDRVLVKEGCGAGHGIDRDLGQAHESALKEAETDAFKRAMICFGNQFGLALYDKTRANVGGAEDEDGAESAPARKPAKKAAKAPANDDEEADPRGPFVGGEDAKRVVAQAEKLLAEATTAKRVEQIADAWLKNYRGRISNNRVDYIEELTARALERVAEAPAKLSAQERVLKRLLGDLEACETIEQVKAFGQGLTDEVLISLGGKRDTLRAAFKEKLGTVAKGSKGADLEEISLQGFFDAIDQLDSGDACDSFEANFRKGAIAYGGAAWKTMKAPQREQVIHRLQGRRELIAERIVGGMAG